MIPGGVRGRDGGLHATVGDCACLGSLRGTNLITNTQSKIETKSNALGLVSLSALVVANMVGAGVFTTSGFAIADLGTPARVMVAWLIGGGIAVLGALSYGVLAKHVAESGGEYVFLSRVVHPAAGFVAGWVSMTAGFTGAIAFAALALEAYLWPDESRPTWIPVRSIAIVAIVLCALLHSWRFRVGVVTQNVKVFVKLTLLVVFIAVGTAHLARQGSSGCGIVDADAVPLAFSLPAFAMTVMWISFSYTGFNAAVYIAEEARRGARDVARSMVVAGVVVTALYLALNGVFVYAAPSEEIAGQSDVATIVAGFLGGDGMALFVRAVIALALVTSVSSMMMVGPRVYSKMAQDGLFFEWFRIRSDAPTASVWLQAGLAIVVVQFAGLLELLSYLGLTLSLSTAATIASLFYLRRHIPIPARLLVAPALFLSCTLSFGIMAAWNRPWEAAACALTIASGLLLYWVMRRLQRSRQLSPRCSS